MQYKVYKMDFICGVHFGKRSLESSELSVCADTIFSALCQEAVHLDNGQLDHLVELVKSGRILLSDAFPYAGEEYYIPKPMLHIETSYEENNSLTKKAFKKLKYISCSEIERYLKGNFDVYQKRPIDQLGQSIEKTSASIRGEQETIPYRIGIYQFQQGNGLYIIVGFEEERDVWFLEELLEQLSFAGIGGKRAAGLGRFQLQSGKIPQELSKRLQTIGEKYMTLSISLPKETELEEVLKNAQYSLVKRSGFVSSEHYAGSQQRKRDLYMIGTGAYVNCRYEGDVFDVSSGGKHPVYRYGKPIFLNLA